MASVFGITICDYLYLLKMDSRTYTYNPYIYVFGKWIHIDVFFPIVIGIFIIFGGTLLGLAIASIITTLQQIVMQ